MRSRKELKKNSGLSLLGKLLACLLSTIMPFAAIAEPIVEGLPSTSFTYVEDNSLLLKLGLTPGPAWCYNSEANSVLITAPKKERDLCELKLKSELAKQKARHDLEVSGLRLRLDTMASEHEAVLQIKNQELESLEQIAVSKPNNYWYAFLTAGIVVGVVSTLVIIEVAE